MKKKILCLGLILIISIFVLTTNAYANGIGTIITSMNGTSSMPSGGGGGINGALNTVISLIQLTGTGISVIVVTMLGIKYLLASPSEKADVKKQIMPILIGCVLLFGAVNLVAAIADFSVVLN